MADPKLYISVFNDGTNDLYIKDAEARNEIESIKSSITGAMHYIGVSTSEITDGASTGPWTINSKTYIASGTPAEGQVLLKAGDVAIYAPSGKTEMEYVWSGTQWQEFGSTGSLKSLAFKDASDIETGGSTSQKLVTTSITGVSGSTTVTGVDGSTSVTGVDGSTSVYGCGDNTTVHDTPTLGTTNIYGCGDNTTVHDTPSLGTTNIYGCGENTTVHDTPSLTAGTAPSMTYDSTNEKLTFSAGAFPTIVAGTAVTVATKAAEATAVGTSIVAGTEVTVATKAASATAVGTSIVEGDAITVATKASSATTVPIAAAAATTVPVAAASATTVPTAAGSATTVATGAVAATDAAGASVVTAVSTTIQDKA